MEGNQRTLEKIRKIRKLFLWAAIGFLIGWLVLSMIAIFGQDQNLIVGRAQSACFVIMLGLFVCVNNFIRLERSNRLTRILAIVGLIANFISMVLAILLIWEVLPYYSYKGSIPSLYVYPEITGTHIVHRETVVARVMLNSIYLAITCFWIPNIMAIKEKMKIIKPLKILSIVCELYCAIFFTISNSTDLEFSEGLSILCIVAFFAFPIFALVAWIISIIAGKMNRRN